MNIFIATSKQLPIVRHYLVIKQEDRISAMTTVPRIVSSQLAEQDSGSVDLCDELQYPPLARVIQTGPQSNADLVQFQSNWLCCVIGRGHVHPKEAKICQMNFKL